MFLGTLGASLLENMFGGKGAFRASKRVIPAGEGKITAGQDFECRLIP